MTLKQRIIALLREEQYEPDGLTPLWGSLQNRHIARHLGAPIASVRRATHELCKAGEIHIMAVGEEGRGPYGPIEYWIPIVAEDRS